MPSGEVGKKRLSNARYHVTKRLHWLTGLSPVLALRHVAGTTSAIGDLPFRLL